VVVAVIEEEASGRSHEIWDEVSIADAIILPMVNEAALMLDEGVAMRTVDIDLVKIHGYGFPSWRGGPMHYAQTRGLAEIVAVLDRLAISDLAEPPCEVLRRAVADGSFKRLERP
jgi:3-hydroxyacyl-CoA dehydrogenase